MDARGVARAKLENTEDGAIRQGRANLALSFILLARVVDWEALCRPDDRGGSARSGLFTLEHLVDLDYRSAAGVMASDHSTYLHIVPC